MHPTGLQYTLLHGSGSKRKEKRKKEKRGWEEVGKIDRSINPTGREKVS